MSDSHDRSIASTKSRRQFLTQIALALLASAAAVEDAAAQGPPPSTTPGAPAFGAASAVGPVVTSATFAEGEKLMQAPLTAPDRSEAAANWRCHGTTR